MYQQKKRGIPAYAWVLIVLAIILAVAPFLLCGGCCGALSLLPTPPPTSTPTITLSPTPGPSPTPTPTSTPTPTPSPQAALESAAQYISGDLRTVEDAGGGYFVVTYDLPTAWDENQAVRMAVMDFTDIASVAFSIEGVNVLELKSFGPFTDVYGNETTEVAFTFIITRAAADKVNWDNVDYHNIGTILMINDGCSAHVHPALRDAWNAYMR